MFESIRGALSKSTQASNNSTSNIMRLRPGNTYVVRLVPYVKDPSKRSFITTRTGGLVKRLVNTRVQLVRKLGAIVTLSQKLGFVLLELALKMKKKKQKCLIGKRTG